jgi:type II secretory pathway pseudopilin PulG
MKKKSLKSKKKSKRIFISNGFTLIETLLALSISTTVLVALGLMARNIFFYNAYVSEGLAYADNSRRVLNTAVTEIREANTANTGAYAINLATENAFTFYSDINSNGLKEKVRYFLSGTTLEKGVTEPTGSPLTYNLTNEKISILIPNVTNSSIFLYYDKNYDGNNAPLTFPINVADIRLVKIILTTNSDPNRFPTSRIFSTQVSIRNLKDNL